MSEQTDRMKAFAQLTLGERFTLLPPPCTDTYEKTGPRTARRLHHPGWLGTTALTIRSSVQLYPLAPEEPPAECWQPLDGAD